MVTLLKRLLVITTVAVCATCIFAVAPPNNKEREDIDPQLSVACDKSPIKDLLEGKDPFDEASGGAKCEARFQQVKKQKDAVKNAIKCAKAKLKKIKSDTDKIRGELEGLLNSQKYKDIVNLERENSRCSKCLLTKCPNSESFCGSVKPPSPPLPPIIEDIGIGYCGMEISFHQPCIGGLGGRSLRGLIGRIKPFDCQSCEPYLCCGKRGIPDEQCALRAFIPPICNQCADKIHCGTTPPPPPIETCCSKVYSACLSSGWASHVAACEVPHPQPGPERSYDTEVKQKFQEIFQYFLRGRCGEVIQKLTDLINMIKDKAKVPTMPPPTYAELCKDIKGDDNPIKVDICEEATKKCQPQCTKKEGNEDILDMKCFTDCIKSFGCEPGVQPQCKTDEDCTKFCPQPLKTGSNEVPPRVCIPERDCPPLPKAKCKDGKCVCDSEIPSENGCTVQLRQTCNLITAPCLPEFCKACSPKSVCK